MTKIAIDLLPLEYREQQLKGIKFIKIQSIGVATILIMVFLSSLTIALRILQSQNILQIQNRITQSEQRVSDQKNNEAALFLLKNRLATINQYIDVPSKQSEIYKLVTQLIPPSVILSAFSVDKSGEVLIVAVAPDSTSVDSLVNNLTDKSSNQDKISQVSLENINSGRDGVYRLSLKIKPKQ